MVKSNGSGVKSCLANLLLLRLADQQQKFHSISAFVQTMMQSMAEIRGNLSDNTIQKNLQNRVLEKVKARV